MDAFEITPLVGAVVMLIVGLVQDFGKSKNEQQNAPRPETWDKKFDE